VLGLARERVRQKQISMDFRCALEIGWMVADERRIRQVLFNLLSNAVKSTPKGGKITFAAIREPGPGGDLIAFTIADSGAGAGPAAQERMFASFVRTGESSPRDDDEAHGTGFGLTLVKSFVELHGGRVELKSADGQGTTVILYVPAGGIAK
jgi:signal transduction histidine kinase